MPRSGKPMSVRMTNAGPLGWVTDKERGYRYQATPSRDRRSRGRRSRQCCSPCGTRSPATRIRPKPASSTTMGRGQDGAASGQGRGGLRRARALGVARRHRRSSASAAPLAQRPDAKVRAPIRAMWWCWAARTGSPITASTACLPAHADLLEEGGRFNLTLRRVTKPLRRDPP